MLDDAQFFVMGFMKGPVCRGQIALNVINDHFFVAFFDPEKDTISNDTAFLASVSDYLDLPARRGDKLNIDILWADYQSKQEKYLDAKGTYLAKLDPAKRGNDIAHIWNGDGHNRQCAVNDFQAF